MNSKFTVFFKSLLSPASATRTAIGVFAVCVSYAINFPDKYAVCSYIFNICGFFLIGSSLGIALAEAVES